MMKLKSGLTIFILLLLIFLGLPILSGNAWLLPESLDPRAVADWLGKILRYWIDFMRYLLKQVKA